MRHFALFAADIDSTIIKGNSNKIHNKHDFLAPRSESSITINGNNYKNA